MDVTWAAIDHPKALFSVIPAEMRPPERHLSRPNATIPV